MHSKECLTHAITLFSLYINDIADCMDDVDLLGVKINNIKVSVLEYVDDLILVASSEPGLQNGWDALHGNINWCTYNTY